VHIALWYYEPLTSTVRVQHQSFTLSNTTSVGVHVYNGSHLTRSQVLPHLSTVTSYRQALLKANATVLATGKNTSLLSILDQIEMET